jgi:aspartate carbamoyltransferase catalytic subunit
MVSINSLKRDSVLTKGLKRPKMGAVSLQEQEILRCAVFRSFLSLKDFDRHSISACSDHEQLEPHARDRRNGDLLKEKTLVTAFYQPSTRTRLATEAAMHRLGGHVTGFSDAKMTRAGDFYQEGIQDTVKMLEYYGDVIAMRHFQQGAPAEAALHASVPVINCGDGWGEHPTQILTDTFTIWRQRGTRRPDLDHDRRHADAHHAQPQLCAEQVRFKVYVIA